MAWAFDGPIPGSVWSAAASAALMFTPPALWAAGAAAIVAHRKQKGQFKSCEALIDIYGIGPKTVANILPVCTTEEPAE